MWLQRYKSSKVLPNDSPRVSQICGMVQGAPPSRIPLVDVSSVLEQELAGDQRTLKIKSQHKFVRLWQWNIAIDFGTKGVF